MFTEKIVLLFLVKVHMIVVFECSCVYDEWVMNGSGKKGIGITLYDFFGFFVDKYSCCSWRNFEKKKEVWSNFGGCRIELAFFVGICAAAIVVSSWAMWKNDSLFIGCHL